MERDDLRVERQIDSDGDTIRAGHRPVTEPEFDRVARREGYVKLDGIDVAEFAFVIGQHVELDDAAVKANPMMLHEAAQAVLATIGRDTP